VQVTGLDHLVLTVADIEATVGFYERLGMSREVFGEGRVALRFGGQKMNLLELGAEIAPHARDPTSGSADICLLIAEPIEQVEAELRSRDRN
jgi:catechol 2,3-dioxygenase-like lactoylglutathione lyase family enzyme